MRTAERLIVNLALEAMEAMPPKKRALHYRALSRLVSCDQLVIQLEETAAKLDQIDQECVQLRMNLPAQTEDDIHA